MAESEQKLCHMQRCNKGRTAKGEQAFITSTLTPRQINGMLSSSCLGSLASNASKRSTLQHATLQLKLNINNRATPSEVKPMIVRDATTAKITVLMLMVLGTNTSHQYTTAFHTNKMKQTTRHHTVQLPHKKTKLIHSTYTIHEGKTSIASTMHHTCE